MSEYTISITNAEGKVIDEFTAELADGELYEHTVVVENPLMTGDVSGGK